MTKRKDIGTESKGKERRGQKVVKGKKLTKETWGTKMKENSKVDEETEEV